MGVDGDKSSIVILYSYFVTLHFKDKTNFALEIFVEWPNSKWQTKTRLDFNG